MLKLSISADEELAAADALREINRGSKLTVPRTLGNIFERWQHFVTEVEKGYELTIYDYTYELGHRDSIEEIIRSLATPFLESVREKVEAVDSRYLLATNSVDRPLAPGVAPESFWWFRIPRVLREELRRDLQSDGYIV